ncbi:MULTISPECIES: antibiotic biosynthesis monooxygenase family protein [Actinomadura]|uniref:Antibiotic biosynthesis monooxygenase family protein n=1 Tax=Actinomadura yumaensis TaxID=111807 RepID=A0ABW2CTH5_9ACTN|nr:antibiotic biosynthesis monooxygenase [Actinomadura sp. J1-007]MWK37492.1 antibiotic biosynthesis monooxygenase [Actinomadura sp. J1-007]
MGSERHFYSIIDYTVDGPETADELVDAFADIQERWVRFYPGYVSSTFLVNVDGTRVYNLVRWASEADYRHFEEVSDTEGRVAAIGAALGGLRGEAEARMTETPRYRVAREITPGPRKDAP